MFKNGINKWVYIVIALIVLATVLCFMRAYKTGKSDLIKRTKAESKPLSITVDEPAYFEDATPFIEYIEDNPFKEYKTKGFCIKGEETSEFLSSLLDGFGLSDKQRDEICASYVCNKLSSNPYNYLRVEVDDAKASAVVIFYKPLTDKIIVPPQEVLPTQVSSKAIWKLEKLNEIE